MHPSDERRRSVFAAIPARLASTRLPGKPLHLLAGRPMIQHVWERAARAPGVDRVVVLTDDERVVDAVRGFGGEVEMTPVECRSGTDRIAWAARAWDAEILLNVQGDEPLIDPRGIGRLAEHLRANPEESMATLASPALPGDLENPNTVKVVLDRAGRALYFSRAGIPFPRVPGAAPVLRHQGLYGYRKDVLLRLAALEPTPLEQSESLEQLRALENGIAIRVLPAERVSWGVDTPEDAERVSRLLEREGEGEGGGT